MVDHQYEKVCSRTKIEKKIPTTESMVNQLLTRRINLEHPVDLDIAKARFPDQFFSYLTSKRDYPKIIAVEYNGNGHVDIKKFWHNAGRSNMVWTDGVDLPKDMEAYIRNLDIVHMKADPEVPAGMRKRIAAIATKYGLNLEALDKIVLKEGRGHASYNRRENSMKVVPEYFLRFGMLRLGKSFVDEFEKTFLHEFSHMIWHQILTDAQKQRYLNTIPTFTPMEVEGEEDQWTLGVGVAIDGEERFGDLYTRVHDPFVSMYARYNPKEDFAESVVWHVLNNKEFSRGFPNREQFMRDVIPIEAKVLSADHHKIEEDGKKLLLAPLVGISLQNNERRRQLASQLTDVVDSHLPEYGVDRQNIKSIVLYGAYTTPEENPDTIKAVAWLEGLCQSPVHIEDGDVELWLYSSQPQADKKIFELRDLEAAAAQRPPAKEILTVEKEKHTAEEMDRGGDAHEENMTARIGPVEDALEEKGPIVEKKLPPGHIRVEAEHGPALRLDRPLKTRFVEQWHRGTKVRHTDFRILVGGKAYSWALPKGLPKRGEKKLAVLQPPHSAKYMGFEGKIKSGYGKGKVKTREAGQAEVTRWLPKKKSFSIFSGRDKGHYTMVPWKGKNWIVIGHERRKRPPEVMYKPRDFRMKFKPQMLKDRDYVVTQRGGGVRTLLYTTPRENRMLTRYERKRGSGFVERTDNFPHVRDLKLPNGVVLDGEVIVNDEKTTNATILSRPDRAREIQARKGAAKFLVHDIVQVDGKDVRSLPFYSRRRILRSVLGKGKGSVVVSSVYKKNKAKAVRRSKTGAYLHDVNAPYDNVGGRLLMPSALNKGLTGGSVPTGRSPHNRHTEPVGPDRTGEVKADPAAQLLPVVAKISPVRTLREQFNPALARLKFRNRMWKDQRYLMQGKLDGSRYLLYTKGYEKSPVNRILSRKISVRRGVGHVERTDNVPHLRDLSLPRDTVIDGEVIRGDFDTTRRIMGSNPDNAVRLQRQYGPIHFAAFDILRHKGRDVRGLPYEKRLKLLERTVPKTKHVSIVPSFTTNKKKRYGTLVRQGWEGVVFKDKTGKYDEKFMSKKKKIETGDFLVVGATYGKGKATGGIGALRLARWSIKERRFVPAGKVGTGLSDQLRRSLREQLPELKGKAVVEVKMMGRYKSGTPRAPVFVRLRADKGKEELKKSSFDISGDDKQAAARLLMQLKKIPNLPKKTTIRLFSKPQDLARELIAIDPTSKDVAGDLHAAVVGGPDWHTIYAHSGKGPKSVLHEMGHVRFGQLKNKISIGGKMKRKYAKLAAMLGKTGAYNEKEIGEELYAYDYARRNAKRLGWKYKLSDFASNLVGRLGVTGARLAWDIG